MLILTRKKNESVVVGNEITLVIEIAGLLRLDLSHNPLVIRPRGWSFGERVQF